MQSNDNTTKERFFTLSKMFWAYVYMTVMVGTIGLVVLFESVVMGKSFAAGRVCMMSESY